MDREQMITTLILAGLQPTRYMSSWVASEALTCRYMMPVGDHVITGTMRSPESALNADWSAFTTGELKGMVIVLERAWIANR